MPGLDELEAMMFTSDDRVNSASVSRPITCPACTYHNPSGAKKCMSCESELPQIMLDSEEEEEEKAPPARGPSMSSPRGLTRDRPSFEEANVDSLDEKEAARITEAYEKMATKYRTPNLNFEAFTQLIRELCKQKPGPSDDDLKEAFELADYNANDQVDLQEFIYLYALVEAGQVTGIGAGSFGMKTSKSKKDTKAKKRAEFMESLEEKRALRRSKGDSFRQNIILPRELMTHDNTGAAEMAIISRVNARKDTAETLSTAKYEWEKRSKQTAPVDIGNVDRATKTSKNKRAEMTIENTGHAELDIKNMKNGRNNAALVLTEAKDQWEGRDKLTVADDVGRLGKLTAAAQSRLNNMGNFEDVGDVEKEKLNIANGRRNTSLALTSAREEWQNRDKVTVPDDMGTLTNKTRSSRNKHDRMTADNTSSKELEQLVVRNGRLISSVSLTNAKAEWEGRNKVTKPQELGHSGAETKASRARNEHLMTVDNTGAEEHIIKMRYQARNLISEDLTNAKNEWEERARLQQENTGDSSVFTVTKEFKDAGKHTKASLRYMDKESKFISPIEIDLKLAKETRNNMSDALTDAKSEWELRRLKGGTGLTEPDTLSYSLMKGTKSSDARDKDRATIEAQEALLRRNINARKALSEAASQASDLYNKRTSNRTNSISLADGPVRTNRATTLRSNSLTRSDSTANQSVKPVKRSSSMSRADQDAADKKRAASLTRSDKTISTASPSVPASPSFKRSGSQSRAKSKSSPRPPPSPLITPMNVDDTPPPPPPLPGSGPIVGGLPITPVTAKPKKSGPQLFKRAGSPRATTTKTSLFKDAINKSPVRRPSSEPTKRPSSPRTKSQPKGRFSGLMPAIYKLVGLDIESDHAPSSTTKEVGGVNSLKKDKFSAPPRGSMNKSSSAKLSSPSKSHQTNKKRPISSNNTSGGGNKLKNAGGLQQSGRGPSESRLSASLARSKENKAKMEESRKRVLNNAKKRASQGIPLLDQRPGTPM